MKKNILYLMQNALLSWYSKNKRNLPWRQEVSFYRVWVSEMMLQQTQVKQGLPYFERFIKRFPDYISLSKANEKEVLKLWQGLGYYSRAMNMHKAAKQIVDEFNGTPPQTFSKIKELKGIGDYTAAAISSIVYNEPQVVVDGNVFRVLSRFFADDTHINTAKGKKQFYDLANKMLDKNNPGDFNQAMMELGALVCKPQNPLCEQCPLKTWCKGQSEWQHFPVKLKKTKNHVRYFNYIIIESNAGIVFRQRKCKDIYKNMYEPFLIETDKAQKNKQFLYSELKKWQVEGNLKLLFDYKKHILTHQTIFFNAFILESQNINTEKFSQQGYFFVLLKNLNQYPVSNIVKKIMQEYINNE